MAIYHRDEYTEKHMQGSGCAFLLTWVAANLAGSTTGTFLARPVFNWQTDGFLAYVVPQTVGGLCLGFFVGLAQAAVLFPYLKLAGSFQWVLATALGRILRVLILSTLISSLPILFPGSFNSISAAMCALFLAVGAIGALAGAVTGYAQSIILRQRVAHSTWWIALNIVISVCILLFTAFVSDSILTDVPPTQHSPDKEFMKDLIIVGIPSLFTGYVLLDLLRHPTSKATWSIPQRKERPVSQVNLEAQLSPEAMLAQSRKARDK